VKGSLRCSRVPTPRFSQVQSEQQQQQGSSTDVIMSMLTSSSSQQSSSGSSHGPGNGPGNGHGHGHGYGAGASNASNLDYLTQYGSGGAGPHRAKGEDCGDAAADSKGVSDPSKSTYSADEVSAMGKYSVSLFMLILCLIFTFFFFFFFFFF
jgi:hypothetical protein